MTIVSDGAFGLQRIGLRRRVAAADATERVETRPPRRLWTGPLMVLLGAWGAGVAYFGPDVGLGPAGAPAWKWSTAHTVLNLLPGLATVAAGMAVITARRAGQRAVANTAILIVMASAAWFVLGAAVYPVLLGGTAPAVGHTGRGPLTDLASVAGYGRGVGMVLGLLSGLALVAVEAPRRGSSRRSPSVDGATLVAAPIVTASTAPDATRGQAGTRWRPEFRSQIARMVPRRAGQADATGPVPPGGARIEVLPGGVGAAAVAGGRDTAWRPRFMSASARAQAPAGTGASSGGPGAPPVPRSVLRPGEWMLAAFPEARLVGADRSAAGQGTAAVTNRRVIFAPEGRRDVEEWSLDHLAGVPSGSAPTVIDLTDDRALDFADSTTGRDFAAALRTAATARQG